MEDSHLACRCGSDRLERRIRRPGDAPGLALVVAGLGLTGPYVGIPLAAIGLIWALRVEGSWACRACGCLLPREPEGSEGLWPAVVVVLVAVAVIVGFLTR